MGHDTPPIVTDPVLPKLTPTIVSSVPPAVLALLGLMEVNTGPS
jgi:hypothetical protein